MKAAYFLMLQFTGVVVDDWFLVVSLIGLALELLAFDKYSFLDLLTLLASEQCRLRQFLLKKDVSSSSYRWKELWHITSRYNRYTKSGPLKPYEYKYMYHN